MEGTKQINKDDYYRVTNCTDSILGRRFPYIPFDDAQKFLNKRGYDIVIHRGEYKNATITQSEFGTGEVNTIGHADMMVEVVMAVKPNEILPSIVSSEEAKEMYIWSVFERELIKKLLFE